MRVPLGRKGFMTSIGRECIALLALLWLLQCFGCSDSDTLERARAAEVDLGLRGPVTVSEVYYWEDGGSIGVILTDSSQQTFPLCVDHQMDLLGTGKRHSTWGHLFFGATYPTHDGATHVKPGASEEQAICAVLEGWLERNVPKGKRKRLMDTGVNELTEMEVKQKRVLWLVECLRTRDPQPAHTAD